MPAKDRFHEIVKIALVKEGWTITHDPLYLSYEGVDMYVDLGAEKMIAAEKDGNKIAVEIKSFISGSHINEFHSALGQFLDYRLALEESEPDRVLYLAVPLDAYSDFFTKRFTQTVMRQFALKLIVYDTEKEMIVTWIN